MRTLLDRCWRVFYFAELHDAHVFWEDNKVKMIDQRILPGRFEIAEFDTVEGVARSIKEMYVRGAPAIGGTGGFGMALAAQNSPARRLVTACLATCCC